MSSLEDSPLFITALSKGLSLLTAFRAGRPSRPEACGLRHLAFSVDDIDAAVAHLESHNVKCETIRVDPYTQKRFTFFNDPDGLPLELYEQ